MAGELDDALRQARRDMDTQQTWARSGVKRDDPRVQSPDSEQVAAILKDFLGRVPRRRWSTLFIGQDPEGQWRLCSQARFDKRLRRGLSEVPVVEVSRITLDKWGETTTAIRLFILRDARVIRPGVEDSWGDPEKLSYELALFLLGKGHVLSSGVRTAGAIRAPFDSFTLLPR